ncbi:hypothetical protein BDE02_15G020700 [Populus trichocarpa]|nr:hypothetical protein BDE02_15G020700 [Populus trichocarpa]
MMKRLVVLYQQHDHKRKDNIEVGMEVIIESNENLAGKMKSRRCYRALQISFSLLVIIDSACPVLLSQDFSSHQCV